MIELRGYIDESGKKPFAAWFSGLDPAAAARITVALTRMEQGNFSNTKGVGTGVREYKIDFGGYRIYFGKDGERIVILLGGGTKKRQNQDIAAAQGRLQTAEAEDGGEGQCH